jgi:metallo-beta-lactamase class B
VKVDRIIRNAEKLKLGAVRLTAHLTPGHTKGCTTWTMPVVEGGRAYTAQFASCTTAPGYKLLGTPAYPEMAADYAATFAKLRRLPCDFFLGTHGSFFDLDAKRAKLAGRPAVNPFLDPQGCRNFIATSEQRFKDQLAREQSVLRE